MSRSLYIIPMLLLYHHYSYEVAFRQQSFPFSLSLSHSETFDRKKTEQLLKSNLWRPKMNSK